MAEMTETGMSVVVFTDLADSTAARSRLGDERADAVRRQHDEIVRRALEHHGGRIVKHLGDGFMAVFGSATRAAEAAIELQVAIEHHNVRPLFDEQLAVRVGISAGDVQWEADDCFGTPVVEAARLVGAANGGQVLAAAVVKILAGTRTDARFIEVGQMDLKGLAAPLDVVEIQWDRDTAPIPLVQWLDPAASWTPLAGRAGDLAILEQAWERTAAGQRDVFLITGEAGAGKSRLMSEFAALHTADATVLGGRCHEGFEVLYEPIVEALRRFVDATPTDELPDALGRSGGELSRLLPELAELVPSLPPPVRADPEVELHRLYEAITTWLVHTVSGKSPPLILVVDDLHWASEATCTLLEHVIEHTAGQRIMIIIGCRDDEVTRTHPAAGLFGMLARLPGAARLQLATLDRSAISELVDFACPDRSDDDRGRLAVELEDRTEGNAFFVGELLRFLAETPTGTAPSRSDRHDETLLGDVPDTVRAVIWMRISKLPEPAVQTLGVAAVIGQEFDAAVLAAATNTERSDVIEHLVEAEERDIIVPTARGRYRFSHALVHAGLYDDMASMRRAALHRDVAAAIERVAGTAVDQHYRELARHLRLADIAAEPGRAAHFALLAGRQALAQHANADARVLLQDALAWYTTEHGAIDPTARCDLLLDVGEAQVRTGDPAFRQTLLDAAASAEALEDGGRMARAIKSMNRGLPTARRPGQGDEIALIERALELLEHEESPARAVLLAQLSSDLFFGGDNDRRLALIDQALDLARRLDDPNALAYVLAVRDTTVHDEDYSPDELIAASEAAGDPRFEFLALIVQDDQRLYHGDREGALAALTRAELLASGIGDERLHFGVLVAKARHAMAGGMLEEAERLSGLALERGQQMQLDDAAAIYGMQVVAIRFLQGRLDELAHLLHHPALLDSNMTESVAVRALIASAAGEHALAREVFEELASDDFSKVLQHGTNPVTRLSIACQVCADLGDRERAAVLYELTLPYRDRFASTTMAWASPVSYPLGRLSAALGRTDEARALFASASSAASDNAPLQHLIEQAMQQLDAPGDP